MDTLYNQLCTLIGTPSNDYVMFLYYVIICFALLYMIELAFYLFKVLFNIKL